MLSKEKYISKHLRKDNLTLYHTIFDIGGISLPDLINRCKKEINKIFGSKYGENLKLENIELEPNGSDDYSYVNAAIVMQEMDEDRDLRIKKEILQLEGQYDQQKQAEKDKKNARIKYEREMYLKLKKKYE